MTTEHLSYCRICAAACGIVVSVEGDEVVRVRGDMQHPISRGYICSKARGLPEWHHAETRLGRPRLRGADASWDELLDDLAASLGGIRDEIGADTIALYLATGLAYDSAGQIAAGTWMRTIGSSSFYSAATVDNAPVLVAAELVTGNPMLNPVWDPTEPGLLLLIGTNPVVSHGYGTTLADPVRRLREYRASGGRIWVLDPRRTESAVLADQHLSVRPGSDVAVLAAIVNDLLTDHIDDDCCVPEDLDALRRALAPFTIERAAAAADVDQAALRALVDDIRRHRGRLAAFCGTGTTMATDGILTEWLRWVLLAITGSLDREHGMHFNRGIVSRPQPPRAGASAASAVGPASRPELPRVAGQVPSVAMVDEIESGQLRALIVTGGNPLSAFPEPDRLRAALATLDVLAVVDVADTELTAIATHVMPATGQLERADLSLAEHVSLRSGIQFTPAVVTPVADRKPVWWMLAALSVRLGTPLLGVTDPEAVDELTFLAGFLAHTDVGAAAVLEAGPRGIDVPIEFGWVRETMLADHRWQIAPPVLLERLVQHRPPEAPAPGSVAMVPLRVMGWSNSIRFAGANGLPELLVHPLDAEAAGVSDGETSSVTTGHGSISVRIVVDDHVRVGVSSLTHGHLGSSPGQLTSAHDDVDPLTTMPWASGVPVTISS